MVVVVKVALPNFGHPAHRNAFGQVLAEDPKGIGERHIALANLQALLMRTPAVSNVNVGRQGCHRPKVVKVIHAVVKTVEPGVREIKAHAVVEAPAKLDHLLGCAEDIAVPDAGKEPSEGRQVLGHDFNARGIEAPERLLRPPEQTRVILDGLAQAHAPNVDDDLRRAAEGRRNFTGLRNRPLHDGNGLLPEAVVIRGKVNHLAPDILRRMDVQFLRVAAARVKGKFEVLIREMEFKKGRLWIQTRELLKLIEPSFQAPL